MGYETLLEQIKAVCAWNSLRYDVAEYCRDQHSSYPAVKILRIPWGIPGIVVLGGGNPRGNLGCK